MSRLRSAARWILTGYSWVWPLGYLCGLLVGHGHAVPGLMLAVASPWLADGINRGGRWLADRIDPPPPPVEIDGPIGLLRIREPVTPEQLAEIRARWEGER